MAPSLFFAATECRVPSIRRKALALLKKAPGKESILGADTSAEVAYRLITTEEKGLGLPDPAKYDETKVSELDDTLLPAEDNRFMRMVVVKNRITKAFELLVTTHKEVDGRLECKFEYVKI